MKITPTLTAGNHTGTYRLRKKQELKKKKKPVVPKPQQQYLL